MAAKGETTTKQDATVPDDTINRNVILTWLKEDAEWLRKKMRNKNPLKNPIRVRLARASIYACSVILGGLKDQDLEEMKERIERIEKVIEQKYGREAII